ncbi:MAG TPA: hypothetical protein VFP12_13700, partial [Allosphingosinicella sp.]|nr:hypothetical protein [Allosphingosinicella sp.]
MSEDKDPCPGPHPDPEVEALLHFEPVVRKCVRHDGWRPGRQREFIIALTILGHAERAAIAVGGTMSGAYKLRTADGGEGFAAAWDSALALHLRRHPRPEPRGRPSRGELQSGVGRKPWPANDAGPSSPIFESPEAEARADDELFEQIVRQYWLKVQAERKARREGRIVAADYYVRQLTYIEIVLEAGGHAHELLKDLKLGGRWINEIVATPMSLLLDYARRLAWKEDDEPERPPLPPLGEHDEQTAVGEPSERTYLGSRDGDYRLWEARQAERIAIAREAQQAWEEKARAEAQA